MDRKKNNTVSTADIENATIEKCGPLDQCSKESYALQRTVYPRKHMGTFNGAVLSTQVVPSATKHAIFFTAAAAYADIPGEQYAQPVKLTPSSWVLCYLAMLLWKIYAYFWKLICKSSSQVGKIENFPHYWEFPLFVQSDYAT